MPMLCNWSAQKIWQSFSNSQYMVYVLYPIMSFFSLQAIHKSVKMLISFLAMHGCSREYIYNHSLDFRDLAATTLRAHLIINFKNLIGGTIA